MPSQDGSNPARTCAFVTAILMLMTPIASALDVPWWPNTSVPPGTVDAPFDLAAWAVGKARDLLAGQAPLNDYLAWAQPVVAPSTTMQRNVGAGVEGSEALPCGMGATLWYRYEALQTASLKAHTHGSDFDTVLAIYRSQGVSPSFPTLSLITCNDDWNSRTSEVSFDVTPGVYYLQAGGYYGQTGTLALTLELTGVDATVPPSNDDMERATPILVTTTISQDTTAATVQPDEPVPCGVTGTVWYRYTATSGGYLAASTSMSDFTSVLVAYAGASYPAGFGSLSQLDCSYHGSMSIPVVAGQTYYFQAGGYYGSSGTLVLSVQAPGPSTDARPGVRNNDDGSCSVYNDANANGIVDPGEEVARAPCAADACFTYNPGAVVNGCVTSGQETTSVGTPTPTLAWWEFCLVGREVCGPLPSPGIAWTETPIVLPTAEGYVELTYACQFGLPCRATLP